MPLNSVHGDIRHLEKKSDAWRLVQAVHGDIRHLEITKPQMSPPLTVHGDIRHLEKIVCIADS